MTKSLNENYGGCCLCFIKLTQKLNVFQCQVLELVMQKCTLQLDKTYKTTEPEADKGLK
jgi:hypothetical protein